VAEQLGADADRWQIVLIVVEHDGSLVLHAEPTRTTVECPECMKAKLDVDFRPYIILGACNPRLAHCALSADLGIGLLLPCNVVIYANGDDTSTVEVMDPEAALGLVGDNPAITAVAREAGARLHRALEALTTS
jgi:hypothetical protein